VMKRLKNELNTDALNVSGQTIGEIAEEAVITMDGVIPEKENARMAEGGIVALYGNLAPNGAVIKQSAVAQEMRTFTGVARIFESEAECLTAIREKTIQEGEVIVIRYEGPKGSPGMPEMLAVTMGLDLGGYQKVGLITDGRFSGATQGPCVGHISPEAFDGGPIGLLQAGDEITIDIPGRKLQAHVSEDEFQERSKSFVAIEKPVPTGYMRRYKKLVSPAYRGAVLE